MHAAGLRLAQNHGRLAVVAKTLEAGDAVLAFLRDLADADLVGDYLDRFRTDDLIFRKLALHSAYILLVDLKCEDATCKFAIFPNHLTTNERRQLQRPCLSCVERLCNTYLSISYLVLHLPRLFRRSTEQEYAAGQPVQPVNGPEILQVVFLRQDKDNGVMPVTAARMHLRSQNGSNGQALFSYRTLVRSIEDNNINWWKRKIDSNMINLIPG